MNPLLAVRHCGQSVWLDRISRGFITGGRLQRLKRRELVTSASLT